MSLPPMNSVIAIGETIRRPVNRDPVIAAIAPTTSGPMVALKGNRVRVRPMATATSLGGSRISRGMVAIMGGTAMAQTPARKSSIIA